jgi:hypothetical protein
MFLTSEMFARLLVPGVGRRHDMSRGVEYFSRA